MTSNMGITMTLANSIIGVSVLAMPFCFKQCGIILSVLMLLVSSILSRYACHFLLKAAIMARRRNFEFLAFHAYGPTGKFLVELCIIGFLMGTCIAFFVVVGDLGPAIVAKTLEVDNSSRLRSTVLISLAIFVVLPLGLLRNVDSLSAISVATIGFYICLVLKVLVEALPHLLAGDWMEKVHLWRPAGILQCIPIFSMALSCQTQLFEIYETLYNASLDRMNDVIKAAINMCTGVYICVGFFGYIAFCTQNFTGNILMSFAPTAASEMFKLGFVLSVAVSFPLVIFPCRASLYSLLFRRAIMYHEGASSHIPENRFKWITIFLVGAALGVGLVIPNIEIVLGLVGSTIGVLICVIFPAAAFIRVSPKASSERLAAQVILFVGILILFLGSYATLYSASDIKPQKYEIPLVPEGKLAADVQHGLNNPLDKNIAGEIAGALAKAQAAIEPAPIAANAKLAEKAAQLAVAEQPGAKAAPAVPAARQEPPVPMEPQVAPPKVLVPAPAVEATAGAAKNEVAPDAAEAVPDAAAPAAAVEEPPKAGGPAIVGHGDAEVPPDMGKVEQKELPRQRVAEEAIRKEDSELAEAQRQAQSEKERKEAELLEALARHKQQQEQLLKEQKYILHEIKKQRKELQGAVESDSAKERTKNELGKSMNKNKVSPGGSAIETKPQEKAVNVAEPAAKSPMSKSIKGDKEIKPNDLLKSELSESRKKQNEVLKPPPIINPSAPKVLVAAGDSSQIGINLQENNEKKLDETQLQMKDSVVAVKNSQAKKLPVQNSSFGSASVQVPSLLDIVYNGKKPQLPSASADNGERKNITEAALGKVLLDRLKGSIAPGKVDTDLKSAKHSDLSPLETVHEREKREAGDVIQEGNCEIGEKPTKTHSLLPSENLARDVNEKMSLNEKSVRHADNVGLESLSAQLPNSEKRAENGKFDVIHEFNVISKGNVSLNNVSAQGQTVSKKHSEVAKGMNVDSNNTENLNLKTAPVFDSDKDLRTVADIGSHMEAVTNTSVSEIAMNVPDAGMQDTVKTLKQLSLPDVSLPPPLSDSNDHLLAGDPKPLSRDLKSAKDDEVEDNT